MNCDDYTYFQSMLGDSGCARYITTVCFQWSGKNVLTRVNQDYPKFKVYQTETECGDGTNTWNYAFDPTFRYMNFYLSNKASAYMQWNMVLDQTGKSAWNWPQNAMITIDTTAKKVIYNGQYYTAKHFSYYVKQNAKKIKDDGNYGVQDATSLYGGPDGHVAFQNPDGSIIVVLERSQTSTATVAVKFGTQMINVSLPGQSLATAVIYDSTATGVNPPYRAAAQVETKFSVRMNRSGGGVVVVTNGHAFDLQLVGLDGSVKATVSSQSGSGFAKANALASGICIVKGFIDGRRYCSTLFLKE
jgi:hypothetical protein